jgi:hypothetical protein
MTPTAHPLETEALDWIPLREGVSFRPLRFTATGYCLQLRVEPGTTIPRHRHTGEVHALTLSGRRELIETREIAGPGTFVYEPAGNADSWRCFGDAPCINQITLTGRIEYVDADGSVREQSDAGTARRQYLDWCRHRGMAPDPALGLRADGALDGPTPPAAPAGGSGPDPAARG